MDNVQNRDSYVIYDYQNPIDVKLEFKKSTAYIQALN
jgi:hypothetical protein